MIKVLFLIPNLGHGGAEKVLVNLVNYMDKTKFDITVMALYDEGVNKEALAKHIHYIYCFKSSFKGVSHVLKLFLPEHLYSWLIKDKYDIVVSYLEGQTARIVSGCCDKEAKLVSWIHVEQHTMSNLARCFRSKREAIKSYNHFTQTICVSRYVKQDFCSILNFEKPCKVLYNTVESDDIRVQAWEPVPDFEKSNTIKMVAVGTLKESKGYERLLRIMKRLVENSYEVKLYILGEGPLQGRIEKYIADNELRDVVILLGYQNNPYKYVAKSDLFVCASYAEGFSTAATEALIVGTPVCTVEVSGMKEMLGDNNEYGIVTKNDEESLYQAVRHLLDSPEKLAYYRKQAKIRGEKFETAETVSEVEKMFLSLL